MAEVMVAAVAGPAGGARRPAIELVVERRPAAPGPGDRAQRPGTGPPLPAAAQPGPRALRHRHPATRWPRRSPTADRRRPARRRQPPRTPATWPTSARSCATDRAVRATLDRLWPVLTPQQLLRDLFAEPDRLAAAAPDCSAADERTCCTGPRARAGPRPTCRCSTRPPSCSARTTGQQWPAAEHDRGRTHRLRRGGARHRHRLQVRSDFEDDAESEILARHRPARRGPAGRAARAAPTDLTTAAAGRRRPDAGPSATSSSTRRRSCRRWPGGC